MPTSLWWGGVARLCVGLRDSEAERLTFMRVAMQLIYVARLDKALTRIPKSATKQANALTGSYRRTPRTRPYFNYVGYANSSIVLERFRCTTLAHVSISYSFYMGTMVTLDQVTSPSVQSYPLASDCYAPDGFDRTLCNEALTIETETFFCKTGGGLTVLWKEEPQGKLN